MQQGTADATRLSPRARPHSGGSSHPRAPSRPSANTPARTPQTSSTPASPSAVLAMRRARSGRSGAGPAHRSPGQAETAAVAVGECQRQLRPGGASPGDRDARSVSGQLSSSAASRSRKRPIGFTGTLAVALRGIAGSPPMSTESRSKATAGRSATVTVRSSRSMPVASPSPAAPRPRRQAGRDRCVRRRTHSRRATGQAAFPSRASAARGRLWSGACRAAAAWQSDAALRHGRARRRAGRCRWTPGRRISFEDGLYRGVRRRKDTIVTHPFMTR